MFCVAGFEAVRVRPERSSKSYVLDIILSMQIFAYQCGILCRSLQHSLTLSHQHPITLFSCQSKSKFTSSGFVDTIFERNPETLGCETKSINTLVHSAIAPTSSDV